MIELRIKEIRLKRNMSQEELSKLSNVSASYISELESNSKIPTILTLCKLADALEVDVSELYVYKRKWKKFIVIFRWEITIFLHSKSL